MSITQTLDQVREMEPLKLRDFSNHPMAAIRYAAVKRVPQKHLVYFVADRDEDVKRILQQRLQTGGHFTHQIQLPNERPAVPNINRIRKILQEGL